MNKGTLLSLPFFVIALSMIFYSIGTGQGNPLGTYPNLQYGAFGIAIAYLGLMFLYLDAESKLRRLKR
jgi:hypothetical protein